MEFTEILGLTAGTITSITFLPQVIQVYKTKSAKDISLSMVLLLTVGVAMWLAYGILILNAAIIYTNSIVLAMAIILLYFKWKFDGTDRR